MAQACPVRKHFTTLLRSAVRCLPFPLLLLRIHISTPIPIAEIHELPPQRSCSSRSPNMAAKSQSVNGSESEFEFIETPKAATPTFEKFEDCGVRTTSVSSPLPPALFWTALQAP